VQPLGSFPAFYGTRKFITAFTRALHLYLSSVRPIQSTTLNPLYKRSFLMLFIYLRLCIPSGPFPSGFITNKLYTFLLSPFVPHAPPTSSSLLYNYNYNWRNVQITQLFLCSFLHSAVTPSLFGSNSLLSILFSNTLRLCSSLTVRDFVSHPYRTTGKVIVFYFLAL
jgi:hypothetical protein